MDGVGQRVEIDRDAVLGGRLAGNLDAGAPGRTRMGHRLDAREPALLVAERHPGHDGSARRDPDLHPCAVQCVVLAPDQLGRHRCSPWLWYVPGRTRAQAQDAARGRVRAAAACGGYRCGTIMRHQVLERTADRGLTNGGHLPAVAHAVHLGHHLGGVIAAARKGVPGQLLAGGLVHQAAEGVLHLGEGLAGEGVDGEHDLVDVHRQPRQVDQDGLVVTALTRAADQVVAGVPDRAVVADQMLEEDHVDRLLVGEQHRGGVEVDLVGAPPEQAAARRRAPPQPHPDRGQRSAVGLLQADALPLGQIDRHAPSLLRTVPAELSGGPLRPYARRRARGAPGPRLWRFCNTGTARPARSGQVTSLRPPSFAAAPSSVHPPRRAAWRRPRTAARPRRPASAPSSPR